MDYSNSNEYTSKFDMLCERVDAEYQELLSAERLKTPDEIINDSWKISCYDDLVSAMREMTFDSEELDALLEIESPIFSVYDYLLREDNSEHMASLCDSIAEAIKKHKPEMQNE